MVAQSKSQLNSSKSACNIVLNAPRGGLCNTPPHLVHMFQNEIRNESTKREHDTLNLLHTISPLHLILSGGARGVVV